MIDALVKELREKIAHFTGCDKVTVEANNGVLEVRSGFWTMFRYNFRTGRVLEGQMHKVGFTPYGLVDLSNTLRAAI